MLRWSSDHATRSRSGERPLKQSGSRGPGSVRSRPYLSPCKPGISGGRSGAHGGGSRAAGNSSTRAGAGTCFPPTRSTSICVSPANEHDGQHAGTLIDAEPEERRPKQVIGDTAYGNIECREALEERSVEVLAQVASTSPKDGTLTSGESYGATAWLSRAPPSTHRHSPPHATLPTGFRLFISAICWESLTAGEDLVALSPQTVPPSNPRRDHAQEYEVAPESSSRCVRSLDRPLGTSSGASGHHPRRLTDRRETSGL